MSGQRGPAIAVFALTAATGTTLTMLGHPAIGLTVALGALAWTLFGLATAAPADDARSDSADPAEQLWAALPDPPPSSESSEPSSDPAALPEELIAAVRYAGEQSGDLVRAVNSGRELTQAMVSQLLDLRRDVTGAASELQSARTLSFQIFGQVQALESSTDEISGVVESIRAVASQTNLLALNATIEASRAGDAGRGFAVVAAEVRTLAQQAREATGKIDSIVAELREMTRTTIEMAENASGQVEDASASMSRILEIMARASTAEPEAREALNDAAARVARVSDVVTELAAIAQPDSRHRGIVSVS